MLAFLKRIRIRIRELLITLSIALPDIFDQIGAIDLSPVLKPMFGDQKTVVMTTVLAVVLAVMRPIIHMRPR